MSLTVLAWLAVAAYALHIVEEHILGWYDWARKTMNISLGWEQYVITEVAILILGIAAAMLSGDKALGPTLVVAFITLLLINVTFFHILPMLANGGKFSPGVISGVFLFLPLVFAVFRTQTLSQNDMVWAVVLGAALILWPMFLLKIKSVPYIAGVSPRAAKRKR